MLNKINSFFTTLFAEDITGSEKEITIEIACAVLLCEVMRADGVFTEQEQAKLTDILQQRFSLSVSEADTALEKAVELSENATDFYQFTSKLNEYFTLEQRIEIINLLWQVAYADDDLASIEEHIIRKIADLLRLRHSEYITTKVTAQRSH